MEIKIKQEPRRFPVEEMGKHIYPYHVELKEEFIRDELGGSSIDEPFRQGKITDVECPLCEKGLLQLKRVDPFYSNSRKARHIGNFYDYVCTGCGATFAGTYSWGSEN